jgi:hypothetical protein
MSDLKWSTLLGTAMIATMLTGCATGRIAWDKPGVTQAERERDENACLRAAIDSDGRAQLLAPYCIDRDTYVRCMEGRGYTVRSQ